MKECEHYDNWCEKEKRSCKNCYYERVYNMIDEENKKLDKENQGLFVLYNFNDSTLLIKILKDYKKIIEKQQKELEQEKEKNKGLEIRANELNGLAEIVERDYIHKDKIKAIKGQLCMQLGSYVRDEASPKQERIAGAINIINKILERGELEWLKK